MLVENEDNNSSLVLCAGVMPVFWIFNPPIHHHRAVLPLEEAFLGSCLADANLRQGFLL